MLKSALLSSVVLALIGIGAAPANATLIVSGGINAPAYDVPTSPIDFTASGKISVTITDCCIVGDYYATIVDGTLIGTTPVVPQNGPTLSSATFFDIVSPGAHTLTLVDMQNWNEYPAGVYYSVSAAAPELSTWAMMLVGFAGLGFAGYRRNKASSLAA